MPDNYPATKPARSRRSAHVLFFAAIPPDAIKDRTAEEWRSIGTGERFRHDTLHMTIQSIAGLDKQDQTFVERARRAVDALRTAPFELCFDRLMTFGRNHDDNALVLATDGLCNHANDLAIELHHALKTAGLAPPTFKKVVPHLTLAYGHGFSETRHLANPIRWTIRHLTLIDSLQGYGRHMQLGTWPLPQDRQQPSLKF